MYETGAETDSCITLASSVCLYETAAETDAAWTFYLKQMLKLNSCNMKLNAEQPSRYKHETDAETM